MKVRLKEEAKAKFTELQAARGRLPQTRFQWAVWISENLDELQKRSQPEEAPKRRRRLDTRLEPRLGLPQPAKRIQPQAMLGSVSARWAQLLQGRTGWHGLSAASGRRMFFRLHHLRTAYVIDIESERVHGHYPYHFTATFRLTDSVMPLCKFEQKWYG